MCFSCHLPIRDVRENQPRYRRAPQTRAAGRWAALRTLGVLVYVGLAVACAMLAPDALFVVLPAALVGIVLHVGKGRVWVGLASAVLVAGSIGAFARQLELPPFEDSPVWYSPLRAQRRRQAALNNR